MFGAETPFCSEAHRLEQAHLVEAVQMESFNWVSFALFRAPNFWQHA